MATKGTATCETQCFSVKQQEIDIPLLLVKTIHLQTQPVDQTSSLKKGCGAPSPRHLRTCKEATSTTVAKEAVSMILHGQAPRPHHISRGAHGPCWIHRLQLDLVWWHGCFGSLNNRHLAVLKQALPCPTMATDPRSFSWVSTMWDAEVCKAQASKSRFATQIFPATILMKGQQPHCRARRKRPA